MCETCFKNGQFSHAVGFETLYTEIFQSDGCSNRKIALYILWLKLIRVRTCAQCGKNVVVFFAERISSDHQ